MWINYKLWHVLIIEQHTDSEDKGVLILLKVVEAQMTSYLTSLGLDNDKILIMIKFLESWNHFNQFVNTR